jgi:phospholipase D1/2
VLANVNLYLPTNALTFCHVLNTACGTSDYVCCAPESRHNAATGSLHSKLWVLQRRGETVAYVGSMDVTRGRYDTRKHNMDQNRSMEPAELVPYYGWHGMMYEMHGPAVSDLAMHFWQRWNDPVTPFPTYNLKPFPWTAPAVKASGSLSTQVLLTLSCQGAEEDGYYKGFAPHGEYTFSAAFTKMVNQTQKYLYLTDQFMFFDEALKVVAENLHHIQKVVLVTDEAIAFVVEPIAGWNITVAADMRYFYQYRAWQYLLADPAQRDKVHFYQLMRPGGEINITNMIYTHAKLYMSDDQLVVVGSHGMERAGFTNDIEVSVGIADAAFVTDLRTNLWAEHLGLPRDSPLLADPLVAIDEWQRQALTGVAKVRPYFPKNVPQSWVQDQL